MDSLLGYLPMLYYLAVMAVCCYLYYEVTEKEKISKVKKTIFWILLAVLAISLYPVGAYIGSLTVDGELISSTFYHGPAGDLLITNSDVTMGDDARGSESFRLQSLDLNTGKVVGRIPLFAPETVIATSDTKIWFYDEDDGISARTPDTLKTLVDEQTLITKNPQLKKGIVDSSLFLDPKTNQIVVTTNDGYNFEIDATTYVAKPITTDQLSSMTPVELETDEPADQYKVPEITLSNKQKLSIDSSSRSAIQKEIGEKTEPFFSNSNLTFLEGSFFVDTTTQYPVEIKAPDSFVMIEKQNVDDDDQVYFHAFLWTEKYFGKQKLFDPKSQDDDFINTDHLFGNTLIIVTDYKIMAIDTVTGFIKWAVKF